MFIKQPNDYNLGFKKKNRFCLINNIDSFVFNNRFILDRVTVDLELIPGTLGVRLEYTLNGDAWSVQGCMHIHPHLTPTDNSEKYSI